MNESEATCKDWLTQIGATNISFVGNQLGPPDFEVTYRDELIAVEVTRTKELINWPQKYEYAFANRLKSYIAKITNETRNCPRWHAFCEYDPRETGLPERNDQYWREQVRNAVQQRGHGGGFQLLPKSKIKGRGVKLRLYPATDEGSFTGVCRDEAIFVASELGKCIPEDIRRKTKIVKERSQSESYTKWWLILSDEIFISYSKGLGADSIHHIRQATRRSKGIGQWSKVVLLTRHVDPSTRPVAFIPLWEDPLHDPLP